MAVAGTATINFGAAPGTNRVVTTVTGQSGIVSGSSVEAFIMGNDSTSDHNTTEHELVPMSFRCTNIVPGTGFDIVAWSEFRLTGTFAVRWVWA